MISTSLVAVISQMLLPKNGGGRVAVPEIMITNHAISNLIREDKVHQIYSQMQLGQRQYRNADSNSSIRETCKEWSYIKRCSYAVFK